MPYEEVRFSGGEPFMYDDFDILLSNLTKRAVIYTNFSLVTDEIIDKISPEMVRFYISLHQEANFLKMKKDLAYLNEKGFRFEVHTIEPAMKSGQMKAMLDELIDLGYETNINKDQWTFKANLEKRRSDICHLDRSLFGPDGKRYPCITKMLEQKDPIRWINYKGTNCCRADCLPCDMASLYGGAGVLKIGDSVYSDEFKG
jgi:hypothetical protein